MPDPSDARDLDLVLFGATGFSGGLTADYLAEHAPSGLRWALAGRSEEKLKAVRSRLAGIDTSLADLELITVDAADAGALATVAGRARVVATAVGPYQEFGEPLVAACALAGTDYVDLTGETEFVDRMYVAHHATAQESGARIVHACGFDSIPHDLGAYFTIQQLAPTGPVTMRGVVRSTGTFSGGTFHSAMGAFSRARQMREAMQSRRKVEPRTEGRSSKAVAGKPHRDKVLGYWLVPLPTIDPFIVARSGAALPAYGPKFRYSHYAGTKTLRYAAGGMGAAASIAVAAQIPPLRNFLLGKVKQGDGPDESRRAKSWFTVDFVAESDGRSIHTQVKGGDPYTETATMFAESVLCLLFDDNPDVVGSVTTAEAMGDNLMARLGAAGISFDVV